MNMKDFNYTLGLLIGALMAFDISLCVCLNDFNTAMTILLIVLFSVLGAIGVLGYLAEKRILVYDIETQTLIPLGKADKYIVGDTEAMTRAIYNLLSK